MAPKNFTVQPREQCDNTGQDVWGRLILCPYHEGRLLWVLLERQAHRVTTEREGERNGTTND